MGKCGPVYEFHVEKRSFSAHRCPTLSETIKYYIVDSNLIRGQLIGLESIASLRTFP
jgi:hypothetical protein